MNLLQLLLLPFALLYGFVALVRNKLFDWKVMPSESYDFPVISVGNLSCGGTGKTPHVEYLIRLLKDKYKIAILSRGYKRKTSGFLMCSDKSTYKDIGDEPLQYCRKYKGIQVAVDEDRRNGIHTLKKHFSDLQAVILDDAFQHRYVKPGLQILTTDFHRLYMEDYPIPSGTLREFRCGAKRADIIIVTKSPRILSPITRRRINGMIRPRLHQQLFYTYLDYGEIIPLSDNAKGEIRDKYNNILMFTGIANSYPLAEYLKNMCNELDALEFMDHHSYSMKDLERIRNEFEKLFTRNKIIVTTEKDAMRLKHNPEFEPILNKLPIYYIPIEIRFHNGENTIFDDLVLKYVGKNQGNLQLSAEAVEGKA